jgi:hypothetical protein
MGHRGGLGKPVAFDEHRAGQLFEAAFDLEGERRGAAEARPDRADVKLFHPRVIRDGRVERGSAGEERRALAIYSLEQIVYLKARHQDQRSRDGHREG